MKKYITILLIFLVALSVIAFYGLKNLKISKKIKEYSNIERISNELNILAQKRKVLIDSPDIEMYNHELVGLSQQFQKQFVYYTSIVSVMDDTKLQKLFNSSSLTKIDTLDKSFERSNLSLEIEKIILHAFKKLNKLESEKDEILRSLFISSTFLVFFGFIVYVREVMASIKAKKLQNEIQQFVDALDESAIVSKADANGIITYVNDKFCEISQYTREELIGVAHNIVRHPDNDSKVFRDLWKTIKSKKVFKDVIKNKTKSGGHYYVDTTIMALLDIDGEIKEYLAVRYDVTELVNARDNAIVADKAKDEFLSNMSHELRTPLNSINGFSSILSRAIKDERHLKYLKNIMESSDNLIGLIDDILDLSKLQSGKFSLDYYDFNLQDKLNLFLGRFDTLVDQADLVFVKNLHLNLDNYFKGDWLRISQIITNLLSNAIKFTPKGKEIEILIKYENTKLYIEVKDNGIGMSTEVQEKVFKPFEQADNSTTREYGGTGLGLSIVTNLVKQMKGSIKLQSKEGEGSTFRVWIPLETAKPSSKTEDTLEEEMEYEALQGHILIAEDNKTNQMLVGILMEEFGLTYTMANDGVEAVDIFGKEEFDLVLMDENMPKLNGCDAMQKIRSLYAKDTPIIALTANAMSGDEDKFLKAGMDAYVAKPIDDSKLYSTIASFLRK